MLNIMKFSNCNRGDIDGARPIDRQFENPEYKKKRHRKVDPAVAFELSEKKLRQFHSLNISLGADTQCFDE